LTQTYQSSAFVGRSLNTDGHQIGFLRTSALEAVAIGGDDTKLITVAEMAGLVGRTVEQRRLLDLVERARGGDAQSVVLVGDPGIGKSTLLSWLGRSADGFVVLHARGHEADTDSGYLILRQLLRPLAQSIADLDTHLAEALQAAIQMLPVSVNEGLVPLAVLELLSIVSETTPLLVIIDDAHLCDHASLAALSFVARRVVVERVLLAFAMRPNEIVDRALLGSLPEMSVTGLDSAASQLLVDASNGAFTPQLFERCQGNPLALQHLSTASVGTDEESLPDRLRDGFSRSIKRYPAATQSALALVALAGSITPEVLTAALHSLGATSADLQPAIDDRMIDSDWAFLHPLRRAAAMPGPAEVAGLHDALAKAYAGHSPDRELLHRLLGSGPHPPELTVLAEATAHELADVNRRDDAHALFVAAAHRESDPVRRSLLWCQAGRAMAFSGQYARSLPFFERAVSEAPDPLTRSRSVRTLIWSQLWTGRPAPLGAAQLHQELLAVTTANADLEQLGMGWASLVAMYIVCDNHAALAALAEMPDVVDVGSDRAAALCIGNVPAALEARRKLEARPRRAALHIDELYLPSAAIHGEMLLMEGRWAEAESWAKSIVDAFREAHLVTELAPAISRRVYSRLFLGDGVTAYGLALATLERSPEDGTILGAAAFVGAVVGAEQAERWARACLEIGQRLGITAFSVDASHRLGLIELAANRPEAAEPYLTQAWEVMTRCGFRQPGYTYARGDIAETFARVGRHDETLAVIAELEAGPFDLPCARGWAARARALLGDHDQFQVAVDLLADSPWEVARTELSWARTVQATEPLTSRRLATSALARFEEMGARPWAAQAREALRTLDVDDDRTSRVAEFAPAPSRSEVDPLAELSDRERTVALAVTRGLSNKDVAGELFISRKTVDAHLQQIYRKLDVRSRTQLSHVCHQGAMVR
jgi:DNA-binding CsgD family transcriptional regulator/tetratricopeptide (TPR) repeat protein